jgi:hypothetical protein
MSGNFVVPPVGDAMYYAQYYKSDTQALLNGATDIWFDLTQSWNNTGGYITSNGITNFTVVQTGLYHLEFNVTILGATWTDLLKQISIDITRSPLTERVTIVQNASIPSSRNYGQSLSAMFYLIAGDVINCRVVNTYTGGTPTVQAFNNSFDLNTWFAWKFIQ